MTEKNVADAIREDRQPEGEMFDLAGEARRLSASLAVAQKWYEVALEGDEMGHLTAKAEYARDQLEEEISKTAFRMGVLRKRCIMLDARPVEDRVLVPLVGPSCLVPVDGQPLQFRAHPQRGALLLDRFAQRRPLAQLRLVGHLHKGGGVLALLSSTTLALAAGEQPRLDEGVHHPLLLRSQCTAPPPAGRLFLAFDAGQLKQGGTISGPWPCRESSSVMRWARRRSAPTTLPTAS